MKLLMGTWLLVVLSQAACDAAMADFNDARGKWRKAAIASYAYDLHETGYLPPAAPTHVTVQNGRVTGVAGIPPDRPPGESVSSAPTIDALFDRIEERLGNDAVTVTVTWDPTLGFPVEVHFDLDFEQTSLQVSAFQPAP